MQRSYKFIGIVVVCLWLLTIFLSRSEAFVSRASGAVKTESAAKLDSHLFSDNLVKAAVDPALFTFSSVFQGSACYNPCLNSYRRCQKKSGRYNKACRQKVVQCWTGCNRDVGFDNPVPNP